MSYALKEVRPLTYQVWLRPSDSKGPIERCIPNTQQNAEIPSAASPERILASLLCNKDLIFPTINDLK